MDRFVFGCRNCGRRSIWSMTSRDNWDFFHVECDHCREYDFGKFRNSLIHFTGECPSCGGPCLWSSEPVEKVGNIYRFWCEVCGGDTWNG